MKRKAKSKDLNKREPLKIEDFNIDPDDCFGKEYSHQDKECDLCSMQFTCQMLCRNINAKLNTVDKGLAETDFSLVDWEAVKDTILDRSVSYMKLFAAVKKRGKGKDNRTVEIVIDNFLIENKFKRDGDDIYAD